MPSHVPQLALFLLGVVLRYHVWAALGESCLLYAIISPVRRPYRLNLCF